jgi:hypothetical protein
VSAEPDGGSTKRRRGYAGGGANEAGSAHRADFAAYLAAHGLADTKIRIGDSIDPGVPRWLSMIIWLGSSVSVAAG